MHNYISQKYLFIEYTLPYILTFLCHRRGVLHLYLAELHKFLNLKLLKLQFRKIIKTFSNVI